MIPTPKDNPMTQNDEAERLARDCELAANRLKDFGAFEAGQSILTDAADLLRTQAARIAVLEAANRGLVRLSEAQSKMLDSEEDRAEAAEAALAEMTRRRDEWRKKAEGYEAVRLALREKVGSPWPANMSRLMWAGIAADEKKRADDAEAEVARLREAVSNVVSGCYPEMVQIARAALQPKQEDV